MDIQTIWIIAAAVSPPVAGVVGFAIQLRQVEKARLENEKLKLELERLSHDRDKMALELTKLTLEIEGLQRQSKKASSRITVATNEQVAKFNGLDIQFSRQRGEPAVLREIAPEEVEAPTIQSNKRGPLRWVLTAAGLAFLAFLAWAYWPR